MFCLCSDTIIQCSSSSWPITDPIILSGVNVLWTWLRLAGEHYVLVRFTSGCQRLLFSFALNMLRSHWPRVFSALRQYFCPIQFPLSSDSSSLALYSVFSPRFFLLVTWAYALFPRIRWQHTSLSAGRVLQITGSWRIVITKEKGKALFSCSIN